MHVSVLGVDGVSDPEGAAGGVVDGRAMRRVRNREAVVQAALDLLVEGESQPTATQVSERSGVSMRSIFRLFDDMEALHRAAIALQVERVVPLLVDLPQDGPVADRVEALIRNRAEVFEIVAPVRRLAVRVAPQSHPVREQLARSNRFYRRQVTEVFAAELAGHPRPGVVLDAIDAATSWEAWERLRSRQDLGPVAATEVMRLTVSSLLAAGA